MRAGAIAEVHGFGSAALIEHHLSVGIAHHRSIRAADALDLLLAILGVSIDALVAEAIDTAERLVDFHTREIRTVAMVKLRVESLKHRFVHRGDAVLIVGNGDVGVKRQFSGFDKAVGIEVELPSGVAHAAHVLVGEACEAGGCRNTTVEHQQVLGVLLIHLKVAGDDIIEETVVDTQVIGSLLFPLQIFQLDVLRIYRA